MKNTLQKRVLAFALVFVMLLPSMMGLLPSAAAEKSITYGEGNVYDIFDLTGSKSNTIKGTDETWDGQIFKDVKEEDKENIIFKTKLTMGEQQVRLALNAKEGTSVFDPPGYAVYINHNSGAPYIAIKRNQKDLVVGSVPAVNGTYELEIGILDILEDGVRAGKHLYVKKDGEVICQVDDKNGYLTGDALGTKIIDFHYGAAIQMDSTYTDIGTYGTGNVYDIFDLTGSKTNTIKGTDETWDGQIHANVKEEHKENIIFKTKLTMGEQQVRLALNAKEGTSIFDPPGYAVYINHNSGAPYIAIKRNQKDLVVGSVPAVNGTYALEIGILDILEDGIRAGKHLYVKKDGEVICQVDDKDGYLTGDALGTKIIDFHYGAAIQMDTTYTDSSTYGEATVYDIYDLTGSATNTIKGTNDTWDGQIYAKISAEHKENMAFKTKLTMGQQQVRLSLNAKDGANIFDPPGYAVYLFGDTNRVEIRRNNATLQSATASGVAGTYVLEIGIVDILQNGNRTGKHLYVKMDDVVVCEYDDMVGYLTGDTLGTQIIDFHYGASIQMDTTKEVEPPEETEPTEPSYTFAAPTVYDIYDLTGSATNTIPGTDAGAWDGQIHANISAEHKENMAFKTELTMGAQEVRLSLNAKEGASVWDAPGYAVYLYGNDNRIQIRRNNSCLQEAAVPGLAGTYVFEAGIVDILQDGNRIGKHLYVKINDVVVCEYDDLSGYLTGDALGTKIVDFHYGAAIQMDTTKEIEPPEPTEPTEPEPTEPTEPAVVANATVYDLYALKGTAQITVPGQLQGVWGTTLGNVNPDHKANVAFTSQMTVDEAQTIMLGLGLGELSQAVQVNSGYVLEIINKTGDGEPDTVKIHRAGTQIFIRDTDVDFHGVHNLEYGIVDILEGSQVVGKRIYVTLDGAEVFHYDDVENFLTADQLGVKVDIYVSGNDLLLGSSKNYAAGEANIYDLYDLQGREEVTLEGRTANPDNWGTTLGDILAAHKSNMAFKTTVTMDEAQTVMLGIGLTELSSAVKLDSGYVLEIVTKTGAGEVDTLKIHRAGTQIYCADQARDFNGEYELEFGVVDLYDQDDGGKVVGKRIYVKVDGEVIISYDDTVSALSDDKLGTKIDVYVSGKKLRMASVRGYQPDQVTVYDLYDLSFREKVEVNHTDDNGNINWGVLIGNVEESSKGNIALKTMATMSRDQQQNLLIGLGLQNHWPVSGGFGYQVELSANPENKNDTLYIYKKTQNSETVCCYSAEQSFDFNSSFQLEVGVVDLLDGSGQVAARRIYVKANGQELMHFDDTKDLIPGSGMGSVVAAYTSSGSAILSTCADSIPSTRLHTYDIYDLLGRASVKLDRTDAGGAVIWTNVLGEISDENSYALRVNVDTSAVDRSTMQEMILGLGKDSDLFDKLGYRLSLYFGTDGGTSLVLRDSATDEVLASNNATFPEKFQMEFGITDFFNSSGELTGKKIYFQADGEEVLSYVDKDKNRARGNLLCAYTTSKVTMTTLYDYITVPVTYVVNGDTVDSSKYITSNTDVIVGKKSIVDITLGNKNALTSVLMKEVLLNGQRIIPVSDKQDVYVFELDNPAVSDRLTVEIQVHNLTVDEAEVYDLYELTGKKEIVIPANSVDQIGTLFADGQEGVLNRAIRFAYYIPKTGGGLRLGYGSDTGDIWSRIGTHIEIWCGFATISHGFHVSALSSGNTEIFKPDSWSIVEVGIVKCYEDGIYKYDRWYVKAGSTLENLELITYYDSTQRQDSTLNIIARTPDTGDDFIVASTLDVRQVTDISEEKAEVAFKPLFLKGEAVKIVVFPQEGKKLESLTVNGQIVETVLTANGGYAFTLENAQEDVFFSYILSDDDRTYTVTAEEAENLTFQMDKTSVAAGGTATVQIKVDGGYTLKSLTVNGVDFLPMASYDKTTLTYTLTLRGIREDKHIQAQCEKVVVIAPVADYVPGDASGTETGNNKPNLPVILSIGAISAVVVAGVIFGLVKKKNKKGSPKNGGPKKGRKLKKSRNTRREKLFIVAFCAPAILHLVVFWAGIQWNSIVMTFTNVLTGEIGFDNFKWAIDALTMATGVDMPQAFKNTMVFFLMNALFIPVCMFFAYLLFRKVLGHKFIRMALYLPGAIGGIMMALLYENFMASDGWLFHQLQQLSGSSEPFSMMTESGLLYVLIYDVLVGVGANLLTWTSIVGRIPKDLIEYGNLEGITPAREFTSVVLPLVWPNFVNMLSIQIIGMFGATGSVLVLTQGKYGTQTLSYWMYSVVLNGDVNEYNHAAALGIVFTLLTIPLYVIFRKIMKRFGTEVEY